MLSAISSRRRFADLSEQEILALAISSEEDDARIYRSFSERLRAQYPASAQVFDGMAIEEDGHRQKGAGAVWRLPRCQLVWVGCMTGFGHTSTLICTQ